MTQTERRIYLIKELLSEQTRHSGIQIPTDPGEQKYLLRALCNVRMPGVVSAEFLAVQDEYLREELAQRGVTDAADLTPAADGLYLWQGDITTLRCDAIVNAANSGMTGCYVPCHKCIDNCIHTFAGVQLRQECAEMMLEQRHEEAAGGAKITRAYNLPCNYILHTVGPIISGPLRKQDEELLASCYRSCLELAERYEIKSIAFCCISTGEFRFPNERAAEIAVRTVKEYRAGHDSSIQVIFNVFKDLDQQIYSKLLQPPYHGNEQVISG